MVDTTFQNSHGLDADNHVTTAMDLAILSRAATQVPHLLDYTKIYQMPFRGGKNELVNFNKLVLLYPGCDGLKTGFTNKSGYCKHRIRGLPMLRASWTGRSRISGLSPSWTRARWLPRRGSSKARRIR